MAKEWTRRLGKLRTEQTAAADAGAENPDAEVAESESGFRPSGGRKPRKRAVIGAVAGLVLLAAGAVGAGKAYVGAHTVTYYHVLLHGSAIGTLENPDQLDTLFEQKRKEYQDKYPDQEMVLQTEGITTEADTAYKPEIESDKTLQKLDGMLKAYAVGVQLKVDGETVGIVKDQAAAAAVLEEVKRHYLPAASGQTEGAAGASLKRTAASSAAPTAASAVPTAAASAAPAASAAADASGSEEAGEIESVKIREQVTVAPVKADPNKVLDVQEAVKTLTEGKEAPLVYTVQEGDTITGIAQRFGVSQQEITANNPGIKELYMQIGDELKLTVPQPPMTVVTVEEVTEDIVTEPEVEIRKSDQLPAGKTKVVRPGQTGLKQMQYRVTKENGTVVQEEWLGQTVVKASLPEVVYRGTKVIGQGSGLFAWPVSGATISSRFGERWGRTHKGVDLVSGNRTIQAADAGTVTFAGQQSGYGNVVIVNHRNGYETVYGHLNSIAVSSGQKLEQGAKIGVMGNTGRSTGTHLHFEIRKNGSALNPMKYLN